MIIAVDFDGILTKTDKPFPAVGTPNFRMINFVLELVAEGHEVVLWTSRTGPALSDALDLCRSYGIQFCAVNDQAPSNKAKYLSAYPQGTRKVNADLYIDDHNPDYILDCNTNGDFVATYHLIKKVKEIIKLWQEEN